MSRSEQRTRGVRTLKYLLQARKIRRRQRRYGLRQFIVGHLRVVFGKDARVQAPRRHQLLLKYANVYRAHIARSHGHRRRESRRISLVLDVALHADDRHRVARGRYP